MPFPRVLVLCEMQSVLSRIWTRVAVSISYEDNHYTTGTFIAFYNSYLGQIVCDKDGVVDWCIVLVEMPLTWFEECWPLPTESFSWTSLKPQHSNPNPNSLANQLSCIDFLTPCTPLIIPQRLPGFLESLMPLKNWCSINARWSKSSLKHSLRFCGNFFQV